MGTGKTFTGRYSGWALEVEQELARQSSEPGGQGKGMVPVWTGEPRAWGEGRDGSGAGSHRGLRAADGPCVFLCQSVEWSAPFFCFFFLSGVGSAFQKATAAVHGGFPGQIVGDGLAGLQRFSERWQRLGVGLRR